jgi:hypothetical protein
VFRLLFPDHRRNSIESMRKQLISAVFSSKTADAMLATLAEMVKCEASNGTVEQRLAARVAAAQAAELATQATACTFLTQLSTEDEAKIDPETKTDHKFESVYGDASCVGAAQAEAVEFEPIASELVTVDAPARPPLAPSQSDRDIDNAAVVPQLLPDRTDAARLAYETACAQVGIIPVSRCVQPKLATNNRPFFPVDGLSAL